MDATGGIVERVHFQIPLEAIPGGAESRGGEFTPKECEEGVALAGNGISRPREREEHQSPMLPWSKSPSIHLTP